MQLILRHKVAEKLVLPLGYHHIIQSMIYHNLKSENHYSDLIHNDGFHFNERKYKLFHFGLLQGKYRIENKQIIFYEDVSLEIRSLDLRFIALLKENIEKNGLNYLGQQYHNISIELKDETIEAEEIEIEMQSPLCVYSTDRNTGKTIYYNPSEEGFYQLICDNFIRKYTASFGVIPEEIQIEAIKFSERDKDITKYKNCYIEAWKGRYILRGKRKYLDYLYQTGLGSKNSQGFGMFRVRK